jgi:FkbM family methyltransferase
MIDIGANIGTIAFPILKTRKDVNAICIEASPRVFKYIWILTYKKMILIIVF